jgi:hypothetical protein
MRRQLAATAILTGTMVAGSVVGLASIASAEDTCDAYASTCPTPSTEVLPSHATKAPETEVEGNSSSLPFTGGEIALMTVAGIAAIGTGTVLVATSRRRRDAAH